VDQTEKQERSSLVAAEQSTESTDRNSVQMYNNKAADSTTFQKISLWNFNIFFTWEAVFSI
jgi:hypothetical protein